MLLYFSFCPIKGSNDGDKKTEKVQAQLKNCLQPRREHKANYSFSFLIKNTVSGVTEIYTSGGTIQDMRVCCKETIYLSSFSQSNTPLAFFLNYFFPISLSLLKKVLKTITSKVATKKKKN